MSKGQSLEDPFLNTLRRERILVSVYLLNGVKLRGHIESFDQFVILLKNNINQIIYKHAISTIVPSRIIYHQINNINNKIYHSNFDYKHLENYK